YRIDTGVMAIGSSVQHGPALLSMREVSGVPLLRCQLTGGDLSSSFILLICSAVSAADAPDINFCNSSEASDVSSSGGLLDPASITCKEMLQFWYLSKNASLTEYRQMYAALSSGDSTPNVNYLVSRTASIMQAQAHMLSAIILEKPQCMTEQLKLVLASGLRRLKTLMESRWKHLWYAHDLSQQFQSASSDFLLAAIALTEMELDAVGSLMEDWDEGHVADTKYYSHEHDGRYSTLEYLRRYTFESIHDLDKGVL
ncbi:hypothetical protein FOZ62_002084, partial [Perkinsus olseni]